ncbi:hypothetical protein J6590_031653 [Homalodisca vitripennis]|nr:hypothetical protein J6590_031653 [Homalodisca vitripennis]
METINKENLGNEDLCLIIGGTNDVARNEGDKFITGIENVLNEKKSHNFVIVDVPHRYDLSDWSRVNSEVKKVNSNLKQLSEKYSNVILVESSKAMRQHHTRHGMHLNTHGKMWLSEQICEAIVKYKQKRIGDSSFKPQQLISDVDVTNQKDLGNAFTS